MEMDENFWLKNLKISCEIKFHWINLRKNTIKKKRGYRRGACFSILIDANNKIGWWEKKFLRMKKPILHHDVFMICMEIEK